MKNGRGVVLDLKPEDVSIEDLYLDPKNPRLTDLNLGKNPSQEVILEALWKHMAVDEVALSIAENGFYRHEPLFAAREGGRLNVIEGNRRLAAVHLLRDEQLRKRVRATGLPSVSAESRRRLATLPVIVCSRESVWTYLGFKHINGPQAWESYPKAHYIAWVHNELKVPLDEIASRIGDKHSTVARLYDALMVLEQSEAAKLFDREDRFKEHFSFSHLTTGLGYGGVQTFLGLPKGDRTVDKKRPVPKTHERHLGDFMLWLYGSKAENRPPVVQSQNPDLRRLDEVLRNRHGTIALRKGLPLQVSLEISKGDERVFREAIVTSKQGLQKARGTVLTGYDGNEDLLKTANDIYELSEALVRDMDVAVKHKARRVRAKR